MAPYDAIWRLSKIFFLFFFFFLLFFFEIFKIIFIDFKWMQKKFAEKNKIFLFFN